RSSLHSIEPKRNPSSESRNNCRYAAMLFQDGCICSNEESRGYQEEVKALETLRSMHGKPTPGVIKRILSGKCRVGFVRHDLLPITANPVARCLTFRAPDTIQLLALWTGLPQGPPRRPLCRVPRRALPSGPTCARGRVLHPRRVERRAPAALVIPRELEVVALSRHADGDPSDAGPGDEQRPQRRGGGA